MNNKGYLTAELVVSAAMALVLATFLINMTLNFKSRNDDEYQDTVFSVEKSVITKRIMDDIQTYDLNKIIKVSESEIAFVYGICPSGHECFHTVRRLMIEEDSKDINITYVTTCTGIKGNIENDACPITDDSKNLEDYYYKTIKNAYKDGDIDFIDEGNDDFEKILNIKIPIKNFFTKEDYSINLLIPYNVNGLSVITSPLNPIPDESSEPEVINVEPMTYTTPNTTSNPYYTYEVKATGYYRLEAWGAQGGALYGAGGKGGYVAGTAHLYIGTKLYIYVGGQGTYTTSTTYNSIGGYNGGGDATNSGGSGGGASDIRLTSGAWNLSASLNSRFLVAGGGGGGQGYSSYSYTGGYGGGTSGGNATYYSSSYYAYGGSQTTGGSSSGTSYNATSGSFGIGGNGGYYSSSSAYAGGGGGGGWYGGGGGHYYGTTGAGGSGFVLSASTAGNTSSSYTVSSQYYLGNPSNIAGNALMPVVTGTGTMTGKEGNGAVRISYES